MAAPLESPPPATERFLTIKEVAGHLKLSVRSVWRGVRGGNLPPPIYPTNRAPRWFWSEIVAYIRERQRIAEVEVRGGYIA